MNRADFKKLALTRLGDAQALLRRRRFSGAYYIAGYAVECALKACIAKKTRRYDFPPDSDYVRKCYTHSIEQLLGPSGLDAAVKSRRERDSSFDRNWSLVNSWSSKSRYVSHSAKEAKEILAAITDSASGVLECIRQYW